MSRHNNAEALRQQALDYIIAHPGALAPEIVAALGWNKSSGATRLADMAARGDMAGAIECFAALAAEIERMAE